MPRKPDSTISKPRSAPKSRSVPKLKTPEAIPTFPTYKARIEEKDRAVDKEIQQLLGILRVLGTPMIQDSEAHFIYYNPFAREVKLAGEFGAWDWNGIPMTRLGKTGLFYRTVELAAPIRIEYKFNVDGQWVLDPFCPNRVDNGVGGENSYFVLGRFQEPPELEWVPTIPHGKVEEFPLTSQFLHNERTVYVYLPPGYSEQPAKKFPVLYVHDGGEYLTRARLAIVLDNLIHSEEVLPLIAVMVNPVNRESEYIGNEDYARLIEQELIPRIDHSYHTRSSREARAVMGASMGGLISSYLALTRPQLFSRVGGQSSAFYLNEDKLVALANQLRTPLTFYLDVGEVETAFIPAHKRLIAILESKGCKCFYQEVPGGHNWTTWRQHLKDLLSYLFNDKRSV